MKKSIFLYAALAVIATGLFSSCEKDSKVDPQSPVLFEDAVAVEGIELDKTSVKFTEKKETAILTATITPEDASDKRVLWKSSDEKVATVKNGVVEAVDYGKAIITATAYAGGATVSCAVDFSKVEVDSRAVDIWGKSDKTVYWSSVNYGAEAPGEFGTYMAWGELAPKTDYSWASYMVALTGWCGTDKDPLKDVDNIADTANDAVKAKWGEGWRMPTLSEVARLLTLDWTWTSNDGVYGYKVENPDSGESIFLPVAGYYSGETLSHPGAKGRYWLGDAGETAVAAWSLDFSSDGYEVDQHNRNLGFVIRPVLDK